MGLLARSRSQTHRFRHPCRVAQFQGDPSSGDRGVALVHSGKPGNLQGSSDSNKSRPVDINPQGLGTPLHLAVEIQIRRQRIFQRINPKRTTVRPVMLQPTATQRTINPGRIRQELCRLPMTCQTTIRLLHNRLPIAQLLAIRQLR